MKQNKSSIQQDFRSGVIPVQLLRFAFPLMLSNAMQLVYSIVDMAIVGKFVGSYGLAAVSNASQITHFATMLCLGFCTAGQVLISQSIGAGKKEKIGGIIRAMTGIMAALCVVFSGALLLFRERIVFWIRVPGEARLMAIDYLVISGIGLFFTFGYNITSAIFRGLGDSRHPFVFILIASAVNLALDLLFVGLWGWGVAGAAAATVIGQGVSLLFSFGFLRRNRESAGLEPGSGGAKVDTDILRRLVKLGIPYAVQSAAVNLSMIFVNSLVNQVGVYAAAAFGAGIRIDDVAARLSQGIMYAAVPMIGQNFAAGNIRRTRQIVWYTLAFSAGMYLVFGAVVFAWPRQIFAFFNQEPEVLELAPVFISAALWSYPAMAMMRAGGGFLQGIGNARLCMILGILDGVVCRVLLSYFMGVTLKLGFYGFVLGYSLATFANGIPSMWAFLRGDWGSRQAVI